MLVFPWFDGVYMKCFEIWRVYYVFTRLGICLLLKEGGVKWGEWLTGGAGPPVAAGSLPPGEQSLPDEHGGTQNLGTGNAPEPKVLPHLPSCQYRGNSRESRGLALPSGRSWQVGSSWTLTRPKKPFGLPPPPALSSQLGRGWSVSAAVLSRPSFPHL